MVNEPELTTESIVEEEEEEVEEAVDDLLEPRWSECPRGRMVLPTSSLRGEAFVVFVMVLLVLVLVLLVVVCWIVVDGLEEINSMYFKDKDKEAFVVATITVLRWLILFKDH